MEEGGIKREKHFRMCILEVSLAWNSLPVMSFGAAA